MRVGSMETAKPSSGPTIVSTVVNGTWLEARAKKNEKPGFRSCDLKPGCAGSVGRPGLAAGHLARTGAVVVDDSVPIVV